jgi:hypothetical protein
VRPGDAARPPAPAPAAEPCGRLGLCGGLAPVGAPRERSDRGGFMTHPVGGEEGLFDVVLRPAGIAFVDNRKQMREVRLPRRRGARVVKGDGL